MTLKQNLFVLFIGLLIFVACSKPSGFSEQAQFKSDTTAIASYLKLNQISAQKTSLGIWYTTDKAGTGFRPAFDDTIIVTYTTKLMSNGTVVEQVTQPTSVPLLNLVTGIQSVISNFEEGSTGRIFIPSAYGYGSQASGNVPANSNLIFDFTLQQVKGFQLKKDTAAVDTYLKLTDAGTYQIDPSGMRYIINVLGTGDSPLPNDNVTVTYSLKLMSTGALIYQTTTPVQFLLSDLILAWRIGLPLIKTGGTISLYVPSRLAYGPQGNGSVPPNTNLVFTISLTSVAH